MHDHLTNESVRVMPFYCGKRSAGICVVLGPRTVQAASRAGPLTSAACTDLASLICDASSRRRAQTWCDLFVAPCALNVFQREEVRLGALGAGRVRRSRLRFFGNLPAHQRHGPLTTRGRPQTWRHLSVTPWTSPACTNMTLLTRRVAHPAASHLPAAPSPRNEGFLGQTPSRRNTARDRLGRVPLHG